MNVPFEVLTSSGSDSSYDLIAQTLHPRPEGDVIFDILGMDATPRLAAFRTNAMAFGRTLLGDADFGLRLVIVQRVPEAFVWKARMTAVVEKTRDRALCYGREGRGMEAAP